MEPFKFYKAPLSLKLLVTMALFQLTYIHSLYTIYE